ncbi:hypothetical protein Q4R69_06300 [Morganella morganii subsp. sibonii]
MQDETALPEAGLMVPVTLLSAPDAVLTLAGGAVAEHHYSECGGM